MQQAWPQSELQARLVWVPTNKHLDKGNWEGLLWACLLDDAVVLFLVPVEAKLADPLKVVGIGAAHLAKLFYHIPGMHLDGNKSHNLQQETE